MAFNTTRIRAIEQKMNSFMRFSFQMFRPIFMRDVLKNILIFFVTGKKPSFFHKDQIQFGDRQTSSWKNLNFHRATSIVICDQISWSQNYIQFVFK